MYTNGIPNYPAIKAVNPLFPMVVHPTSIALLVYPAVVYTKSIYASIPNGCVCTLMAHATLLHPVKALNSVFPMVMYPRLTSLIFYFVSVTKSCLRYWHTQLPCTQGSKLCVPNGFAPKISIIAGIPSGCVHKIHITASTQQL